MSTTTTPARIVFTIPADMADAMDKRSPAIYLDVFGGVRLTETTEKIGDWARMVPPRGVTPYKGQYA